jgi:hypothetical protein
MLNHYFSQFSHTFSAFTTITHHFCILSQVKEHYPSFLLNFFRFRQTFIYFICFRNTFLCFVIIFIHFLYNIIHSITFSTKATLRFSMQLSSQSKVICCYPETSLIPILFDNGSNAHKYSVCKIYFKTFLFYCI